MVERKTIILLDSTIVPEDMLAYTRLCDLNPNEGFSKAATRMSCWIDGRRPRYVNHFSGIIGHAENLSCRFHLGEGGQINITLEILMTVNSGRKKGNALRVVVFW